MPEADAVPDPRKPRVPRWRHAATAALLIALAALTIIQLATGGGGHGAAEADPPDQALQHREVVAATEAALAAWADFAAGDLDDLDAHFHPDGPQYAQLADEATQHDDTQPTPVEYRFIFTDPTVTIDGEMAQLRAAVTFHRPQGTETYQWQLELREDQGHGWRVWTITERSPH